MSIHYVLPAVLENENVYLKIILYEDIRSLGRLTVSLFLIFSLTTSKSNLK